MNSPMNSKVIKYHFYIKDTLTLLIPLLTFLWTTLVLVILIIELSILIKNLLITVYCLISQT